MTKIQSVDQHELTKFINEHIAEFHDARLNALKKVKLEEILKKKNPYLFKAKNIQTCEELIRVLLDAFLSSQEETIFGEFLEKLAIFVCGKTRSGYKSGIPAVDLEIEEGNTRYIIAIKSGPKWSNKSSLSAMKEDFKKAKKTLRTQKSGINVVAINGCCYGRDTRPDKGDYFKYCGQEFWAFISGDEDFYLEIIEPLGHKAKEKNEAFQNEYAKLINRMTIDFSLKYCKANGEIDWETIVRLNSQKKVKKSAVSKKKKV